MDPVSDIFIRIKNAQNAHKDSVEVPYSTFTHEIAKTLERAGLLTKIERKGKRVRKILAITLRYEGDTPLVREVKLLSKPSRRLYASYKDLRPSRRGGVFILSTPKGVLTGEEAREQKVGGALIAEIW